MTSGEGTVKNRNANGAMWLMILSLVFLGVPWFSLLLATGGIFFGIRGIAFSRVTSVGKGQSWTSLILSAIWANLAFIIIVVGILSSVSIKSQNRSDEEYFTNFVVATSKESELREFRDKHIEYQRRAGSKYIYQDKYKDVVDRIKYYDEEKLISSNAREILNADVESLQASGDIAELNALLNKLNYITDNAIKYESEVSKLDLDGLTEKSILISSALSELEKIRAKELEEEKIIKEKAKKEQEKKLAKLEKSVRKQYDEFDEITWYTHSSVPKYDNTRSYLSVYFQVSNSKARNLRFKNVYTADDWLFIESYEYKTDNNQYSIYKGHFGVERDNGYGDIWEWYDDPVDSELRNMLEDIASSKKVLIRYNGKQYQKDRTISTEEKNAVRDMLELYDSLNKG
ncbi:hypothetical protein KDL29_10965 [bacterium]|nr:hypothetical protein [bacterium]